MKERTTFWQAISRIDRRIVYIILLVVLIVPLVLSLGLSVKPLSNVTARVRQVYDQVDSLQYTGRPLMISVDFDPASQGELLPMLKAMLGHAFARNVRVIVLGMWPNGAGLARRAIEETAHAMDKKNGVDYVFLGYKAGVDAVILGMGENIANTFPRDGFGLSTADHPMMQDIKKLSDIGFLVSLSAGTPGYTDWLLYAQARYKVKMATGTTAVQAADAYPYLGTGQLLGIIAGMKGAAEYEVLVTQAELPQVSTPAVNAMDAQSFAQFAIIILVLIGNVGFFLSGRRRQ
ncbi:MAG: hypothetical protein R6X13_11905 [bacterium]